MKLTTRYGLLALHDNDDSLLVFIYPEGDCDTFKWPLNETDRRPKEKQVAQIKACLYDMREMGEIPSSTTEFELPDGTILEIGE